jgi:mRNA interferase HigB
MHVIAKRTLREFWEKRPDAEQPLKAWHNLAKSAIWHTPADIKAQFRSASFVGNNRVVFNIAGNKYRLVVVVRYRIQRVFVRFIGTHQEYDKINVSEV